MNKKFDGLYIPEYPFKKISRIRFSYTGTRIDAIRFLKREYFIPFDKDITGFEDWDFDRRFKGRKGVVHSGLCHYPKRHLLRKFYYMKWLPRYILKHPKSLLYELNPFYRLWLIIKR